MSISNLTGWPTSPAVTPVEGVTLSDNNNPSPAIRDLHLKGTYVQDGKNHAAFYIDTAAGYTHLRTEISSSQPNTIVLTVMHDPNGLPITIGSVVETSLNYQTNNFYVIFEVVMHGEATKTYTFRKGMCGGGRPDNP